MANSWGPQDGHPEDNDIYKAPTPEASPKKSVNSDDCKSPTPELSTEKSIKQAAGWEDVASTEPKQAAGWEDVASTEPKQAAGWKDVASTEPKQAAGEDVDPTELTHNPESEGEGSGSTKTLDEDAELQSLITNHTQFPVFPGTTGWVSCIVRRTKHFLDAYTPAAIASAGLFKTGGLNTSFKLGLGQGAEPSIIFRSRVVDGSNRPNACTTHVSLRRAAIQVTQHTLADIPTDDPLVNNKAKANGFQPSNTRLMAAVHERMASSENPLTEFFPVFSHIKIRVPRKDVHTQVSAINKYENDATKALLRRWTNHFRSSAFDIEYHLYFVPDEYSQEWMTALVNPNIWSQPYNEELNSCRDKLHIDLTYDNVVRSGQVEKADIARTPVFLSDEHRTVTLQVGNVLEHEYTEVRAQALQDVELPCALIPKAGTAWNDPYASQTHGVIADGAPTQFFAVASLDNEDGSQDIVIGENEPCSFFFPKLTFKHRTLPQNNSPNASAVTEHGRQIANRLTDIHSQAYQDALASVEQEGLDDDQETDTRTRVTYLVRAAEYLRTFLTGPSQAALDKHPKGKPEQHLQFTAKEVADQLRPGETGYLDRCIEWARQHSTGRTANYDADWGPRWPGRRLRVPDGVTKNVALFEIRTPCEAPWTAGLQAPPVRVDTETISIANRSLSSALNSVTRLASLKGVLWIQPDDTTTKAECSVVHRINNTGPNSQCRSKADYLRAFDSSLAPKTDFLAKFPIVKRDIASGIWSTEQTEFIRKLSNSNGIEFLQGVPGSGKSTTAQKLSHCLAKSERRVAYLLPANTRVDDAHKRLSALMPDMVVKRAHTWKGSHSAVMSGPSNTAQIALSGTATEQEAQRFTNEIATAQAKLDPAQNEHSVAMYARHLAETGTSKDKFKVMQTNVRHQCELIQCREQATIFLIEALARCNVVVCTPVAFIQLINHAKTEFDMVVVDEAAMLSESLALAPIAFTPNALTLYAGDHEQTKPVVQSVDDNAFYNHYAMQRTMPILRRAYEAGKTFLLCDNYRAQGSVHNWVVDHHYDGRMNIVNSKCDVSILRDWLKTTFGASMRTQTVFMLMTNSNSAKCGTSTFNPDHADHIAHFLPYISKTFPRQHIKGEILKVLVLSPYRAQKREILDRVTRLVKEGTIPVGQVDVRTIDQAPSMEGDVVITDLTADRSASARFVDESNRFVVANTRARLFHFVLGNHDNYKRWKAHSDGTRRDNGCFTIDRTNNVITNTANNNTVQVPYLHDVTPSNWDLQKCRTCGDIGHGSARCPTSIVCHKCQRKGPRKQM
jgi:hypothetical protein